MKALVNNQNNTLVFEGFHKYLIRKKNFSELKN